MSIIHTFGDSHSIITHKISFCRENWLGFNTDLPRTMFRFGNEGLDLHQAIKLVGNGHEKFPIKEGEYAMYFYGEIDTRWHILRQRDKGEKLQSIIQDLVNKYIIKILENEIKFKCKSIAYCILPPLKKENIPETYGTQDERLIVSKLINDELKNKCKENNIYFVDIRQYITDEDGFFKNEFSDNVCHLATNHCTILENELLKL